MDAKGIVNQGLRKLGSYSVNSLAPASTPLERQCADGYPQWRDSEIMKRRWVFCWLPFKLTTQGAASQATSERPFAFDIPADCLAVVRKRGDTWRQHGKQIYTSQNYLELEGKFRVGEENFDPLFVDALAWRVAQEMCEWVTQSNVKKSDTIAAYKDAIRTAAAANALVLGAEDQISEPDEQDEWVLARTGFGL